MKKWRLPVLFSVGGLLYCGIELAWRRWTRVSMFLLGGTCFVTLGKLGAVFRRLPLLLRALMAAGIITTLELLWGLAVNRRYKVWDYRAMPLNYRGQICLPYFAAWMPLGLLALWLYGKMDQLITCKSVSCRL